MLLRCLAIAALFASLCTAQAYRFDEIATTVIGNTAPPGKPALAAIPFAGITVCTNPANGVPCTNFATTYKDVSASTPCPAGTQVTMSNSTTCVATADAQGNFGFWVVPGHYQYQTGSQTWDLVLGANGNVDLSLVNYQPAHAPVNMNFLQYLEDQMNDVRNWQAVGVTGNCHTSTVDNSTFIQAALNSAWVNGPPDVYLPVGFCWPIGFHVWNPPGVTLHSEGRTSGYEVSSPTGGVLIANANWATNNTTFPYSQMVWSTGSNQTSGTFLASGNTFGSVVRNLEINCNDQVGCGNLLGVGRAEKSQWLNLVLTGGVPFGGGGFAYGIYEEGIDCNDGTPPAAGCLLQSAGGGGNPFSGEQGPDDNLEIFPSYNNPQPNFILYANMGSANYKGLTNSTLNGIGAGIAQGGYFWGTNSKMGPGIHVEGTVGVKGIYIGNIPAGSSCVGANNVNFENLDAVVTIAGPCASQQELTFINNPAGVINNVNSTTVTQGNYYFSSGPPTVFGWPGVDGNASTTAAWTIRDPGDFEMVGHNGWNLWNGNSHSGLMGQPLLDTGSIFMRASMCSNLWWDSNNGQIWRVGANGSGDWGCTVFGNGFTGLAAAQGTVNTTISQTTMQNNVAVATNTAGHTFFGKNIINGSTGGIAPADNGSSVQSQDSASEKVLTVSTLPATCTAGQHQSVSDATTPTYNGALTGGGSIFTPVYCIGSNTWHSF